MRTLSLFLVSSALLLGAGDVGAQGVRGVGGLAGWVQGKHVRERAGPSESRSGLMGGLFIDVATNKSWFDVMAEGYLIQRGAKIPAGDLTAESEADYLSMAVLAKTRLGIGPASIYLYAGPNLDMNLRSRASAELEATYRNAAPQVFGLAFGAGIELDIRREDTVRLEIRGDEGLTNAFPEAADDVRHRAVSIVLRYGRRPGG